ncbi:MAG: hypothetical protein ACLP50_20795 [Solirubrobacteraceae bacterium]
MNPEQTLIYERRVRDRTAVAAALAGVLLIVASVITLGGPHTSVNELTLDLLVANERFPRDLISSIITGIAALSAAWTLVYLYNAAHARNPMVKPYIRIVAILGGALSAVSGIAYAIIVATKVHEFATTGIQTYQEADRLTSGGGLLVLQLLGQASALLVAVGFVLVSLQAMQQGLLTRFMGYLGMFAGALFLFQITQVPVVQCYWLLAVAYLISGRWPTGLPPAWVSGRSQPWPSSAELRAQRAARGGAARGGGGGFFGGRSKPAPAGASTAQAAGAGVVEDGAGRTRATTPKRKRKHRR